MNNRGGDRIVSIYWFFILFLVAGAIVYMTAIFYGEPYDIRDFEVRLLSNKLADCVSSGGYVKDNVFTTEFKENFLEQCRLNFDVEEFQGWNNDQFFVKLVFYNFDVTKEDGLGDYIFEVYKGNSNLEDYCNKDENNFPVCLERKFYSLDRGEEDKSYVIKTVAVVRKTEKNVR